MVGVIKDVNARKHSLHKSPAVVPSSVRPRLLRREVWKTLRCRLRASSLRRGTRTIDASALRPQCQHLALRLYLRKR